MSRDLDRFYGLVPQYLATLSIVGVGMGCSMAIDLIVYAVSGRLLTPAQFGYLGVASSIYYIALRSPFAVIEKLSEKAQASGADDVSIISFYSVVAGVALGVLTLGASGFLSSILRVPQLVFVAIGPVFPLAYFSAAVLGRVQAKKDFRRYAKYEITSSVAGLFCIPLMISGLGAPGAATVFLFESVGGIGYLLKGSLTRVKIGRFSQRRTLLNCLCRTTAVYSAFSLDLVAVNYFFSGEVAGAYSAVSVLGKGIFFASIAVNRSVFPEMVRGERTGLTGLANPIMSIIAVGVGSGSVLYFYGPEVVGTLFGLGYDGVVSFGPSLMITISVIGVAALISDYLVSRNNRFCRAALVMPVLQVALILSYHSTARQIVHSTLLSALTTCLVLGVVAVRSKRE